MSIAHFVFICHCHLSSIFQSSLSLFTSLLSSGHSPGACFQRPLWRDRCCLHLRRRPQRRYIRAENAPRRADGVHAALLSQGELWEVIFECTTGMHTVTFCLFYSSVSMYLLNSNHFSAIKQTLLSFIFPFFSHPPHDYSSSSFSSSSHPLSSSSSLIFFFYISQPTLENLATFTNRPDLLSAASKAHLPPALVQAGAATGRVPASGDIKMVRLQQERNRERERERDDLNRRRR